MRAHFHEQIHRAGRNFPRLLRLGSALQFQQMTQPFLRLEQVLIGCIQCLPVSSPGPAGVKSKQT